MNFIGCDVSKQKLDCALLCASDKLLNKTVANSAAGVQELLAWVAKKAALAPESLHVVLEATGPYHEIAAQALFDAGCRVSVVNPAYPKHYAQSQGIKTKTDRADAAVLARYGQATPASKLRLWQPPAPVYRQLQTLHNRRQALLADLQRERNRQEKLLATQGDDFVSASLQRMLAQFEKELELVDQAIETHIAAHPDLQRDRGLLQSIPGVGEAVCRVLLPVLQSGRFENARQAAAYLGLRPVSEQSGTSVKTRPRLSKAGNSRVRATLYLPAVAATRYNPHIRALYERLLANGKAKMAALGACMRKLVHICFGVLKTQTPYSPSAA